MGVCCWPRECVTMTGIVGRSWHNLLHCMLDSKHPNTLVVSNHAGKGLQHTWLCDIECGQVGQSIRFSAKCVGQVLHCNIRLFLPHMQMCHVPWKQRPTLVGSEKKNAVLQTAHCICCSTYVWVAQLFQFGLRGSGQHATCQLLTARWQGNNASS